MNNRETLPLTRKMLLVSLHAGFLLIGVIAVLLGQILPILSKRLFLSDREAGYLFVAQFTGSLCGTFFYNRIIKRFGYLPMLAGAFYLMAIGCIGLNFDSWFWSLTAIFLYGIGIGSTIPAINLLIVELDRRKSSSALNAINFFWGIGAIFCKPFIDYVGSPESVFLPTIVLCLSFLLMGAVFSVSDFRENSQQTDIFSEPLTVPIWKTTTARLIAVFGFVHIGIESSVGGWITTYESRLTHATANAWLSAAPFFFLFLVVGRGVAPLLFRFLTENVLLFCNLIIMTAGTIFILRAENLSSLLTGAAILGFGTSSVFPTNMSRFTKIFGAQSTRNAAPLFVFGSLGGAFATWFVGLVSTVFNSLQKGFLVILISCLVLVLLQIILVSIKSPKLFDETIPANRL